MLFPYYSDKSILSRRNLFLVFGEFIVKTHYNGNSWESNAFVLNGKCESLLEFMLLLLLLRRFSHVQLCVIP